MRPTSIGVQAGKKSVLWTVFPPNEHGRRLPDEMPRLKALEDEITRLKKIVADLTLDREMESRWTLPVRENPRTDVIRRKL